MRIMNSRHARLGRYLALLLTLLVFVALMVVDGQRYFAQASSHSTFLLDLLRYGTALFIAIFFLAVGTPVWLFARDRRVAILLFCFSFTMMMTFALQTGALAGVPVLEAISDAGAALSLALLATLLLFFPVNHYAIRFERVSQPGEIPYIRQHFKPLPWYLELIWALNIPLVVLNILYYLGGISSVQIWLYTFVDGYYLLVLMGIIATIIFTYRRLSSPRERQQLRFFIIGVIVAIAPLLLLTVLPELLADFGLHATRFIVDSQISTVSMILLPAAFAYSILRYQILVFDRYIERVVAWTMGVIFLTLLGYGVGVVCGVFFLQPRVLYTGTLISALVVLAPVCWWLAGFVTERLFFREMRHYRRVVEKPEALADETMDLDGTAELLTLAVINTFRTSEACLYVFDRDSGHFQLAPPLSEERASDGPRQRLAGQLMAALQSQVAGDLRMHTPPLQNANWIGAGVPLIRNVNKARRPLFLSEAVKAEDEQPSGLALFISTSPVVNDPLLVPVRVQGEMIGLLALGEHGDHGQYSGPDFEIIDLLLSRYAPLVENARLYEQASRHGAMLNSLYSMSASLERSYQSVDEVAVAYAAVAAETAKAGADVWLAGGDGRTLRYIDHAGEGIIGRRHYGGIAQESDWRPWFYDGPAARQGSSAGMPSFIKQGPDYPCAWLPLEKGEQRFGALALTYTRPHLFAEEEKRLWSMFVSQCAAAIENAQASIDLREAYERQKELDQLKDRFIMTASHELRTPLTAVQGYIDLLQSYEGKLTPEVRAEFIAKAARGCDELALLVNNMMEAGRVQEDVETLELTPLPLAAHVSQVLEMMDLLIRSEGRKVSVDIPQDVQVMTEEQRLKQVILNLVSNALKYSRPGTSLEISAQPGDDASQQPFCTLRIRDYGSGIPIEERQRLFERFVRLKRDMNSAVRGAGLGLFICRHLIEAMGGSISVESTGREGEGSTFVISLKQYRPAQVPVQ